MIKVTLRSGKSLVCKYMTDFVLSKVEESKRRMFTGKVTSQRRGARK